MNAEQVQVEKKKGRGRPLTKQENRKKFKYVSAGKFNDETANAIGIRIERIKKRTGKQIVTPKEIVQDARDSTSPYHNLFTWDDSIAGEKYREEEARLILRSIVEVRIVAGVQKDVRTFVNIISEEGERGYATLSEIEFKPQLMNQVIVDALEEAKRWKERWHTYKELSRISNAIDETLQEFEDK